MLLTTQYLDEADQLADDVVVMEEGRVIARGTPDELKALVGGDRLDVTLDGESGESGLERARTIVATVSTGVTEVDRATRTVSAPVAHRAQALTEVVRELGRADMGSRTSGCGARRSTTCS